MTTPRFTYRLLVAGDVTIDHDVLATLSTSPHTNADGEIVYDSVRRYTTAGGAGITARYLSVTNRGDTYLAAFTAPTLWSSDLREVLDKSALTDRAITPPQLISNFTAEARMPLISRLIEVSRDMTEFTRNTRWDDVGDFTLLHAYKRKALLEGIQSISCGTERGTGSYDGIVLNDLDLGTVDHNLAVGLARLASDTGIPLVIDPKRDYDKYRGVTAFAITPNLQEWYYLIQSTQSRGLRSYTDYRNFLDSPAVLQDIATRSVIMFPDIRYHIITCDKDGIVLIGPVQVGAEVLVRRLETQPLKASAKQGPGDVFAAQFLVSYLESKTRMPEVDAVKEAGIWGMAAASAHLSATWQSMPSLSEVAGQVNTLKAKQIREYAVEYPSDVYWNRFGPEINLSDFRTAIDGFYTTYNEYGAVFAAIVDHIKTQRESTLPKPLLIGGPSGSGKSGILNELQRIFSGRESFMFNNNGSTLSTDLEALCQEASGSSPATVVVIDEADKAIDVIRNNIRYIDSAKESRVLFVFAGSGFEEELRDDRRFRELYDRCERRFLTSLDNRPGDVLLLLASRLSDELRDSGDNGMFRLSKLLFTEVVAKVSAQNTARTISLLARDYARSLRADVFGVSLGREGVESKTVLPVRQRNTREP